MTLFSFFSLLLIGPLKLVFELIYSLANVIIGHPGLAIVALSLMMNILVLPLYRRADAMQEQARDMDAKLADGIAHIKQHFTGDERMMILQTYYRQNNYSPLSALNGSVSLLLEIPFFMAAYQFLSHVEALSGVPLGPIADLSAPDGLLSWGGAQSVNLLPILMTAINVISSAIYLKGFPLKTKVQLYGIAAVFLVFLYDSPAGLVFYWTLNNVFSLVKNIFYKIPNPRKVLAVLCSLAGLTLIAVGVGVMGMAYPKRLILLCGLGIALQLPLLLPVAMARLPIPYLRAPAPSPKLFLWGCLFLTGLIGLYIPSTYIADSPQEYMDVVLQLHPLWHVAYTFTLAAGTFLIWFRVFYWLANDTGKAILDKLIWIACGVMLMNYMFFGTNLGVVTSTLQFGNSISFTTAQQLGNLAAICIAALVLLLVQVKWRNAAVSVLLTATLALGCISGINVFTAYRSIADGSASLLTQAAAPKFTMTTQGKNVVVLFLDRAMGAYVPYLMNEDPEMQQQFEGFTYYSNVVSYSWATNAASPAMMGGYEYTPVEMNKRSDTSIPDKHNEALMLLPVLFDEQGFDVTVCDAPYVNYQYIPDFSIFDDYPNINTFITEGKFNEEAQKRTAFENTHRNFFCFALMKTMPLMLQPALYNNGNYLQCAASGEAALYGNQIQQSLTNATVLDTNFLSTYNVLANMSAMMEVTQDPQNTYLFLANNTTHTPTLLQTPDYVPAEKVDNSAYEAEHADRFTLDGASLHMDDLNQVTHYHANMAALQILGDWFDDLRARGLYDNTRIILVADHGRYLYQMDELLYNNNGEILDLCSYYPLLMVKDFNAADPFAVSDEFMTNADVPTLATENLIESPVNPFTGKPINMEDKTAHDQLLISMAGSDWRIELNNGNQFKPAYWFRVKDNIRNPENWEYLSEPTVLTEHAFPD